MTVNAQGQITPSNAPKFLGVSVSVGDLVHACCWAGNVAANTCHDDLGNVYQPFVDASAVRHFLSVATVPGTPTVTIVGPNILGLHFGLVYYGAVANVLQSSFPTSPQAVAAQAVG